MEPTNGGPTEEEVKEWIKRRSDGFGSDFDATRDVSAKVGDEALRFLGLAQLGGIAGCLGFIGAVKQANLIIGGALALFILGVVSLLVAHLLRYRSILSAGQFIAHQSYEFSANPTKAVSDKLYQDMKDRSAKFVDYSLYAALASAVLFVGGSGFAAAAALAIGPIPAATTSIVTSSPSNQPAPTASAPVAASRPAVEKNTGSSPMR